MKIGIIVLFFNHEEQLQFKNIFKNIENIELCFVNNGSKDDTLGMLKYIKNEFLPNAHIIDIKKTVQPDAAIRAGSRYFYNIKELYYIGYIHANEFKDFNKINTLLDEFNMHKKSLLNAATKKSKIAHKIERKSCNKVFSVLDKLTKFQAHKKLNFVS